MDGNFICALKVAVLQGGSEQLPNGTGFVFATNPIAVASQPTVDLSIANWVAISSFALSSAFPIGSPGFQPPTEPFLL